MIERLSLDGEHVRTQARLHLRRQKNIDGRTVTTEERIELQTIQATKVLLHERVTVTDDQWHIDLVDEDNTVYAQYRLPLDRSSLGE